MDFPMRCLLFIFLFFFLKHFVYMYFVTVLFLFFLGCSCFLLLVCNRAAVRGTFSDASTYDVPPEDLR